MIVSTTVEGRKATVAYLHSDWTLAEPANADLLKVVFDDGGVIFLKPDKRQLGDRYDPDQPRVPAGDPEGGQWTSGGGGGGGGSGREEALSTPRGGGAVRAARLPAAYPRRGDRAIEGFRRNLGLREVKSAPEFHGAISRAKANKFGASVHVYDPADYAGMRTFTGDNGRIGFALKGDDIVSGFKHPDSEVENAMDRMLPIAVAEGGRKLDAFDTILPDIYSRSGFRAVARVAWNDAFAPAGWDYETYAKYNGGRPDVVFMVYDPANAGYNAGDGTLTDYDTAVRLQEEALRDIALREQHLVSTVPAGVETVGNAKLNAAVPLARWDPPAEHAWLEGTNAAVRNNPIEANGKWVRAGVVIREPDGSTWVVKPSGGFEGGNYTFPKGGGGYVGSDLSPQQTAVKEAWEESGLRVRITGHAGDFERGKSISRYYYAERVGGLPEPRDGETEAVVLVAPDKLSEVLSSPREQEVLRGLAPAPDDPFLPPEGEGGFGAAIAREPLSMPEPPAPARPASRIAGMHVGGKGNFTSGEFRISQGAQPEAQRFTDTFNRLPASYTSFVRLGGSTAPPRLYKDGGEDVTTKDPVTRMYATAYYTRAYGHTVFYADKLTKPGALVEGDDYSRVVAHELGHQWDHQHGQISDKWAFVSVYGAAVDMWKHEMANATPERRAELRQDDYYMSNTHEAWATASEVLMLPEGITHSPELLSVLQRSGVIDEASKFYHEQGVLTAPTDFKGEAEAAMRERLNPGANVKWET